MSKERKKNVGYASAIPIDYFGKIVCPSRLHNRKVLSIEILTAKHLERYKHHRRLQVYYNKGCKCVCCSMEAYYFVVTRSIDGRGQHKDLYSKDFELLTVDHIMPKSRGGSEKLHNKQPMCEKHNSQKGNKII